MSDNRQVTVYDETGHQRRVSRAVAEAMGWSASHPTNSAQSGECEFCGTPMEPGATVGMLICPRCDARLFDSQTS